jgi:hypothetical protein
MRAAYLNTDMNHKNKNSDRSVAILFSQNEGGGGVRMSYNLRYFKFSLSLSLIGVAEVASLVQYVDWLIFTKVLGLRVAPIFRVEQPKNSSRTALQSI